MTGLRQLPRPNQFADGADLPLPPRKTVRNKNGARFNRAPFLCRQQKLGQAALPFAFIASSARRPVSSAMWSNAAL